MLVAPRPARRVAAQRPVLARPLLFGFSTQILWITTRGGVWHTGQLIATLLTFGCLLELWGKRRAWLIGLLAGAAFLTRAPLAFAMPFYALLLDQRVRSWRSDPLGALDRGWLARRPAVDRLLLPAYNQVRFGSPFESGYALATLPALLEEQRALGLFALAHVPMNLDYFLFHLPTSSRIRRSSSPTASGCPSS